MSHRSNLSHLLAAAMGVGIVLAPALPALALTVVTRDGRSLKADQVYYTNTHLIVIKDLADMELVPNGEVKTVDGIPFEQAYWDQKPASVDNIESPAPTPTAAAKGDWPMRPGTQRRYNLTKSITTWVRHGQDIQRRTSQSGSGSAVETVETSALPGKVAMTEVIRERLDDKPAHEVRLQDQIEPRPDGYYLMGQSMEDEQLRTPKLSDRISTPPRLWPNTFTVGDTWIVGPFERMGLNQVGRMKVVGREAVTVPAGTYPDAFKVTGYGHVFDGTQLLKGGRLVTDHGTLETTTWFVPGLGPVKEESKLHIHQDYFPTSPAGTEVPLVVEEHTVRTLAEYQLGR